MGTGTSVLISAYKALAISLIPYPGDRLTFNALAVPSLLAMNALEGRSQRRLCVTHGSEDVALSRYRFAGASSHSCIPANVSYGNRSTVHGRQSRPALSISTCVVANGFDTCMRSGAGSLPPVVV